MLVLVLPRSFALLHLKPPPQLLVLVFQPADFILHLLEPSVIVFLPFLGLCFQGLLEVVILIEVLLVLLLEYLFSHVQELEDDFLEIIRNAGVDVPDDLVLKLNLPLHLVQQLLLIAALVLQLHLQRLVLVLDELVLVAQVGQLSSQLVHVSFRLEEVHLLSLIRQVVLVPALLVGVGHLLGDLCEGVMEFFDFGADPEEEGAGLGGGALVVALIVVLSPYGSKRMVGLFDAMLAALQLPTFVLELS